MGGWGLKRRRHEGTFWGDEYVRYLACSACWFMDVCIYQNSSNGTLKICALHYT